ncbi:MAG: DUF167 domain-containing protein [Helicobacteraceae bacterium]|jgi:uncharacterized protein (TIGR00251 family)|nr:DUF167 domain-containing protein [Helicobacteraceae bacterium]
MPSEIALHVRVTPNAAKDKFVGVINGEWAIKLRAPALDNKANAALIVFIAKMLSIPKSEVVIRKGERSRRKTVALPDRARIRDILTQIVEGKI